MQLKQRPNGVWFIDDRAHGGGRISTGIKTAKSSFRQLPADIQSQLQAKQREIVAGVAPEAQRSATKALGASGLTMRDLFEKCLKTVWSPAEAKSQATVLSNAKVLVGIGVTASDEAKGRHPDGLAVVTADPCSGDMRTWHLGVRPVNEMSFSALEDVVAALRSAGYSPGTIKRKLDAISKALRMATKWTDSRGRQLLGDKPPMPTVRVSNLKDRIIHGAADAHLMGVPDEEAAIFAAVEARRVSEPDRPWFRISAFLRFLIDVGSRLGESLNVGPNSADINWLPVLLADGTIERRPAVVFPRYSTKNDKPRTVPLTDAAWQALLSQKEHAGIRKIKKLGGQCEDKLVYFPLKESRVWYMFDQIKADLASQGLDLSGVTLHTFRHTCLTRLAQGGKLDLHRLMLWAGHSDPKITTERYAHLMPSNLMDGLLTLGSSNGGLPPVERRESSPTASDIVPATIANDAMMVVH